MLSLKRRQSGFTIVELLIVIVVIIILAGLVITTFVGVQQKARDTERRTDINAVHAQIEAYYSQSGKYPSLANINDATASTGFRAVNFKGLDANAYADPKTTGTTTFSATAPATGTYVYGYVVTPSGCDNTATDCTGYTLVTNLESGGTYTKTGLAN